MAKATWHTAVYAFDNHEDNGLEYGMNVETVTFKSAAQTRNGLVRTADNKAFWDCVLNYNGYYIRLLTVDGNAA